MSISDHIYSHLCLGDSYIENTPKGTLVILLPFNVISIILSFAILGGSSLGKDPHMLTHEILCT